MNLGVIAIIVIFKPELRRGLEQLGTNKLTRFFGIDKDLSTKAKEDIYKVVIAATELSKSKTGALIVIERDIKIGDIIRTGVNLNSEITSELIVNIFVPNTPLHDGAVILGDHKIKAAACFLPLSQNETLSNELGTRHRAGIGITESTDAVVVIVSEETGKISVAMDGEISRNMSEEKLTDILTKAFTRELGYGKKNKVWRFKKNGK
jgi:diadenylate cyclase